MATNDRMQTALDRAASLKREVENAEELVRDVAGTGGKTAIDAQRNLDETIAKYEESLRDVSDAKRGT
ncbi:MAG: hypothetical protein PSV40_16305 [Polaromonas sp.]|uniref:hypothetical protein n=1 Tax=Polaromonas sp. TaxID=1869339 RepID=UPI0024884E3F|nr:hypothetical protein [Polaromonas sp.]MDI1270646.1 hypothetical protein [Polaromonas sp.]